MGSGLDAGASARNDESENRILAAARSWIGTPYRHQASLKGIGCDCLGLLRGVWRETVGPEPEAPPPYAADGTLDPAETLLAAAARHLIPISVAEAVPGDVLLFRWKAHLPARHCAILSGPDLIVHAHEGACVAEVALTRGWARRVSHAFRFPERTA